MSDAKKLRLLISQSLRDEVEADQKEKVQVHLVDDEQSIRASWNRIHRRADRGEMRLLFLQISNSG